jgi:hypothetical protein
MNYQEAKEIRGKRLRDLLADNLISGGSVKESVKKTLSQRTQAKIKGMKETFDPLNIAKFITGGSKLGPALLGRLMGRSQEDINYFTGTPNKVVNNLEEHNPLLKVLDKMYTFMNKNYLDDIKRRELEKNYLEEKQIEDEKRHNILIETLKKLMARIGRLQGPTQQEESGGTGGGILGGLQDLVTKRAARMTVAQATASASKIAANKIAGFTLSSTLKKLPIAGLLVGGFFAGKRLLTEGDVVGAAGEVASGAASAIPLVGTAAGLGIDLMILTREVYKDVFAIRPEADPERDVRFKLIAGIVEKAIKDAAPKPPPAEQSEVGNAFATVATPGRKGQGSSATGVGQQLGTTGTAAQLPASSTGSPPMGANLQGVQDTNQNLNIQKMAPQPESSPPNIINVPGDADNNDLKISSVIPPVRTNESTFRDSIYNSTVVV